MVSRPRRRALEQNTLGARRLDPRCGNTPARGRRATPVHPALDGPAPSGGPSSAAR
ncbi:hypothetical protein ACFQZ4_43090 [Catellatospora coxensis]